MAGNSHTPVTPTRIDITYPPCPSSWTWRTGYPYPMPDPLIPECPATKGMMNSCGWDKICQIFFMHLHENGMPECTPQLFHRKLSDSDKSPALVCRVDAECYKIPRWSRGLANLREKLKSQQLDGVGFEVRDPYMIRILRKAVSDRVRAIVESVTTGPLDTSLGFQCSSILFCKRLAESTEEPTVRFPHLPKYLKAELASLPEEAIRAEYSALPESAKLPGAVYEFTMVYLPGPGDPCPCCPWKCAP
ncbi:hypothetical protein EJ06DRAFT_417879 [Trichodelitschia bisporula]|uniref:Uncharacterized protein n=1 Tax=Trichodelitschia bisporula TaxID=703511 RepID=A0A6G1HYC9_9PEZI|nr:hypothetical protein EJ06DRAFT_417879 [Trichodelitschia bisporula]